MGTGSPRTRAIAIGSTPTRRRTGLRWLQHNVDRMLAAYEGWLAAESLPPVTPWDGVRRAPWDPTQDLALPTTLDGTFTGVSTLDDLGAALRDRYLDVANVASELNGFGLLKAPFSYRYWSYMRWAKDMRRRFQGLVVFPTGQVYDRDGTPLSATPFTDTFNDLHRNWHVNGTSSGVVTPGLTSTAGQRTGQGIPGLPAGEEFLRFHRDHLELFHRWLARADQPPLRPHDMGRPGAGRRPTAPPVVNPPSPWTYDEASMAGSDLDTLATIGAVGGIEFGYHGTGPRAEHGHRAALAQQLRPPLPQLARLDRRAVVVARAPLRAVEPDDGRADEDLPAVLQDGSDFPGPLAISIVRDPEQPAGGSRPRTPSAAST